MFFVINFVFFSFLVIFLSTCDTVHRALLQSPDELQAVLVHPQPHSRPRSHAAPPTG